MAISNEDKLLFQIQVLNKNKWINKLSVVCVYDKALEYYKGTEVGKASAKRLYCPSLGGSLITNRLKKRKPKVKVKALSKPSLIIKVSSEELLSMNKIVDELRERAALYHPETAEYTLSDFMLWLYYNPPEA